MSVSRDEVERIAALAKLRYSPNEMERFVQQFQQILDYFGQLERAPIAGVAPTYQAVSEACPATPTRMDEVKPSLGPSAAVANAPQAGGNQFRVPRVIE